MLLAVIGLLRSKFNGGVDGAAVQLSILWQNIHETLWCQLVTPGNIPDNHPATEKQNFSLFHTPETEYEFTR